MIRRARSLVHLLGSLVLVVIVIVGATPRTGARAASTQAAAPFNLNVAGWSWAPQAVLNPFNPQSIGAILNPLLNNPLAYYSMGMRTYRPELAVSWQITPQYIVVNLRHGVVWHDNVPFTSKDVVTTFLVGRTLGWAVWNLITSVRAQGAYQVVFDLPANVSRQHTANLVLTQYIYPDHLWGHYLPANISSLVRQGNEAALQKVGQAIVKVTAAKWIGTGPFQIGSIGPSQMILTKFPRFWLADRVHVPQIVINQTVSNQAAWGQMLSGQADFAWAAAPLTIVRQWLSKSPNHYIAPWAIQTFAMFFNNRRYPMSLPQFRQAVAYAVNRAPVTALSDPSNVPESVPTGLVPSVEQVWLSPATMRALNPYAYNPAKAAALLNGIGFKKTAAGWVMPNGQPVKLTLTAPAGWSDTIIMMEAIASQLKQFGFDVTATAGAQPGYWSDVTQGNYDIAWDFGVIGTDDPIQEFYNVFVALNLDPNNPQNKGIGFGPTVKLNYFGTVNIMAFLRAMARSNDNAKIRQAVSALVQMENQQLPILPIEVRRQQVYYSARTYTHWPAPSDPLWADAGTGPPTGLSLMIQQGYVVPQ